MNCFAKLSERDWISRRYPNGHSPVTGGNSPRNKGRNSSLSDLLETTYLNKIERSQEEDIEKHEEDKVLYQGERIEGRYASVKTTIVTYKGTEIPVEYRLIKEDGEWKAYDIVIEGVSLVSNYRSQFNRIIHSESYDELVKKLREKTIKEE